MDDIKAKPSIPAIVVHTGLLFIIMKAITIFPIFALLYTNPVESRNKLTDSFRPRNIIVDVDAGIDDFHALVFLLNAEKLRQIKIAAIILTDGNTSLKDVKVNVCRLLEMMNIKHIRIYAGSSHTILNEKKPDDHFGSDGFGDLNLKKKPKLNIIKNTIAPTAIAKMVKFRPKYYDYLALAPLTNLGLAMTMYEHVAKDIGDIFIMGGNFGDGTEAEFNFKNDPESAYIVLNAVVSPVTLFPFEACINKHMTIGLRLGMANRVNNSYFNPVWMLNDRAEKIIFSKLDHQAGYQSCDPILVSMVLVPSIIKGTSLHKANVQLRGDDRGKVFIENATNSVANVKMIHGFHAKVYEEMYVSEFKNVCKFYRCNQLYLY